MFRTWNMMAHYLTKKGWCREARCGLATTPIRGNADEETPGMASARVYKLGRLPTAHFLIIDLYNN